MISYIIVILLITFFFGIWVEYSVGGIFLRPDSTGSIKLNFPFYYLLHPLTSSILWKIEFLDINYIFILFISLVSYYYVKNRH